MSQSSQTQKIFWANQTIQASFALIFCIGAVVLSVLSLYPDFLRSLGFIHSTVVYNFNHYVFPFFFFLVTLEARREVLSDSGQLRGKKALYPLLMALGGMVVPIGVFYALSGETDPRSGLFIPVATDIAFVVLASNLLRVSSRLKTNLLALALGDDVGGIFLMAIFFNEGVMPFVVLGASFVVAILAHFYQHKIDEIRFLRHQESWLLVCVGLIVVFHLFHVHTTLAGVLAACLVPYAPGAKRLQEEKVLSASVFHKLEELGLHYAVAWFVVPVFVFLNTGFDVSQLSLEAFTSLLFWGIALGLAIGKPLGVSAAVFLIRCFNPQWSPGDSWLEVIMGAWLCGIGLTVAIFFSTLSTNLLPSLALTAILTGSFLSFLMALFCKLLIVIRA